ncbi:MAG: TonB-dependent receptor plug domain-containing protein, partial [Sphingomonadales bacterium]
IVHYVEENVLNSDLTQSQFRPLITDKNRDEQILSGNIGLDFGDNGIFRLNGLYSFGGYDENMHEDHFNIDNTNGQVLAAFEDTIFYFEGNKWEIGGDYERKIGRLGNLKTVFVLNQANRLDSIIQDHTEAGVKTNNFDSLADYQTKEQIFRTSITTPFGEKHSFEWGGEGAFNTLDKSQSFANAANDIAIVKENRYEVFATHNYTLGETASLQSTFTKEFSKVFQDREGITNTRKYSFLKPRFEFRYDFSGSDQLRIMSERKVSQLNLSNFIASRNIQDDSIDFGNPNLVPQKTWEHSISYEKRLSKDAGSFELKFKYEYISDHIDRIQIGEPLNYTSGVGNIGDAKKYGFDVKGNLRLGFLGLPKALLTASYTHSYHETTDPFTGKKRLMKQPLGRFWMIDFQHDLTELKTKYGFNIHHQAVNYRFDIRLLEELKALYHFGFYIEHTFKNIKAKFNTSHIFGDHKRGTKTFYVGDIKNNIIDSILTNKNHNAPEFYLSFQTTF